MPCPNSVEEFPLIAIFAAKVEEITAIAAIEEIPSTHFLSENLLARLEKTGSI
jgi:hypothetical protein